MLTVNFGDEFFFGGRRKESGQALGTYEDLEPEFSFRTALTQVQNLLPCQQCSKSGSGSTDSGSGSSGSTCFWASWIRIRLHQSEVWIRIRLRILVLLSSCKNSKKNLDSYFFVTLFELLSLKNYVNVPSKSNTVSRKNV
jgi:hypothetical protein